MVIWKVFIKEKTLSEIFLIFFKVFLCKKDNKLKFKIHLFINNKAFRKNFTSSVKME